MNTATLTISRTKSAEQPAAETVLDHCPAVTLEQPGFAAGSDTVTIKQLTEMVNAARNGDSAWTVMRDACEYVEFDAEDEGLIHVRLPFFALPTDPSLDFELTAGGVTLAGGWRTTLQKTRDAVFSGSDVAQLPYCYSSGRLTALMPAYSDTGRRLEVTAALQGDSVRLSQPATTVYRVDGEVTAYRYEAQLTLDKKPKKTVVYRDSAGRELRREEAEMWQQATASSVAVLAVWLCQTAQGGLEQRTAQLSLQIPGCVNALLKVCPDGRRKEPFPLPPVKTLRVYYSTCTGRVLKTVVIE